MKYKKTAGDILFDIILYTIVVFVLIVTIYPIVYTFSMAISDPIEAARGNVWLLPAGLSFSAMETVLKDPNVLIYYLNTIWYTIVGTLTGIITTTLMAYPLSRTEFRSRTFFYKIIMFTMFFSGGLIPTYIVVTQYAHLYNNRWALILPALTSAWYVTVTKNFFQSLPGEVIECARIDGASEYRIFGQIVIPLSKPVLAVLSMYYAISHWNGYFNAMLYLSDMELHPMSLYVRRVVIQGTMSDLIDAAAEVSPEMLLSSMQLKYAVIVVTVLPMLLIYPFLSKYFEKGLLIGSIKG